MNSKRKNDLTPIFDLIDKLRSPNGCPWDKEQTPGSMGKYLVEESLEANTAILSGENLDIMDELGDTLFQLCFIIHLFKEKGLFSLNDIVENTLSKMISRHPHVFGDESAKTCEDVKKTWQRVKDEENKEKGASIFDKIPSGLPALMLALKISKAAVNVGFEWDDIDGVMDKVYEEVEEFKASLGSIDKEEAEMEFGDILFTLVNIGRFAGIESESALIKSCVKFEKRFRWMEKEAVKKGCSIEDVERGEMENLWNMAKNIC